VRNSLLVFKNTLKFYWISNLWAFCGREIHLRILENRLKYHKWKMYQTLIFPDFVFFGILSFSRFWVFRDFEFFEILSISRFWVFRILSFSRFCVFRDFEYFEILSIQDFEHSGFCFFGILLQCLIHNLIMCWKFFDKKINFITKKKNFITFGLWVYTGSKGFLVSFSLMYNTFWSDW
jgi:hypothetical protein